MQPVSIHIAATQKIRFVAAVFTFFGFMGLLIFSVPGLLIAFLIAASVSGMDGVEPVPSEAVVAISIGLTILFALTYASFRAIRVASAMRRGEPSAEREAKCIAILLLPVGLLIGVLCLSRISRYYQDHVQQVMRAKNHFADGQDVAIAA